MLRGLRNCPFAGKRALVLSASLSVSPSRVHLHSSPRPTRHATGVTTRQTHAPRPGRRCRPDACRLDRDPRRMRPRPGEDYAQGCAPVDRRTVASADLARSHPFPRRGRLRAGGLCKPLRRRSAGIRSRSRLPAHAARSLSGTGDRHGPGPPARGTGCSGRDNTAAWYARFDLPNAPAGQGSLRGCCGTCRRAR